MFITAAFLLLAAGQAPLHDAQYPDVDIAYGAKVYAEKCVTCHGTQGDAIGGVNLRSGRFRNAVVDRDLERFIRAGSPAGMPAFNLDNAEMAGVIAYLRNMNASDNTAAKTGDVTRGRGIVEGKGGCATCHRIGVTGSRVAPNLSQMMPINRPVRAVMKNGATINGRRLNEDTYSVQLIDDKEQLHSLLKSDIQQLTVSTTSPMPSFKGTLSDAEIADVVAYLLSLKGQ